MAKPDFLVLRDYEILGLDLHTIDADANGSLTCQLRLDILDLARAAAAPAPCLVKPCSPCASPSTSGAGIG
jgi:hypothetical protein